MLSKLAAAIAVGTVFAAASAASEPFEMRYDFQLLTRDQSEISALNRFSLFREVAPGLRFGTTLYSAAGGDAGGMFTGGFELAGRATLGPRTSLELGGFLGGGGGVHVVEGDGFMAAANLALIQRIAGSWSGTLGVSYIYIDGSEISSPAVTFGLAKDLDFALSGGHGRPSDAPENGAPVFAVKPLARAFIPLNSQRRDGSDLDPMRLLGGELSFGLPNRPNDRVFVQASAAVDGDGEGYAEWLLGYRWGWTLGRLQAFTDLGLGYGGGGGVDTGSGVLGTAGLGVALPLMRGFNLEVGASAVAALDGEFAVIAPFVGGSIDLGGANGRFRDSPDGIAARHWQLTLGTSVQRSNADFRKVDFIGMGDPVLIETALDLFLNQWTYFTLNAQTVVAGRAGGYAVGQLGLGREFPLSERWIASAEGFVGAAGGDGVDTGGGLIFGGRVELDYLLANGNRLSAGIGSFASRGGASPVTGHFGIKIPFTTYH